MLNLLPEPQVARFIRLLPQTWLQGGASCLRAEILACPVSGRQSDKGWVSRVKPPAWIPPLPRVHSSPDPNDLFPKAPALVSSDPLDFRHHDYKAMRKVRHTREPGGTSCLS